MIDRYRLEDSLEPAHPKSTVSDRAFAAVDVQTGERVLVKRLFLGFPLREESRRSYHDLIGRLLTIDAPHIVRVLAGGIDDEGPWYAMRFVKGETVAARVRRGERYEGVADLFPQIGAALATANKHVLPDHIAAQHMIIADGRVHLWGFGFGEWRVQSERLVQGQYTASGQLRWSVNLTPSALKGLPPSERDSPPALALLAYAMLAGRWFWDADRSAHGSIMELFREVMSPPRAPGVSAAFDAWFARCFLGDFEDAAAAITAFAT